MSAIDDQNAKQIRDAMDVEIQLDATDTSYGDVITITNENLIRATVSLRSDLSIINPTLPESEINVEAYWPEDVAEAVAAIPEDTPITYSAGYPGDMSPVRKFYVSGQVTWADNILTIHGVDAVHFLDMKLPTQIWISGSPRNIRQVTCYMLDLAKVTAIENVTAAATGLNSSNVAFDTEATFRETIAAFTWMMRSSAIKFWYVDAGIPTFNLTTEKTVPDYTVLEEDCANVTKRVEPKLKKITINYNDLTYPEGRCIVGTFDWTKNGPAYVKLNDFTRTFGFYSEIYGGLDLLPTIKPDSTAENSVYTPPVRDNWRLWKLYSAKTPEEAMVGESLAGQPIAPYSQVVPWGTLQAAAWNRMVQDGKIAADQDAVTWDIGGFGFSPEPKTYEAEIETEIEGIEATVDFSAFYGIIPYSATFTFFPNNAAKRALETSNVTGAFTWKGDPRMQPRDIATYVLRDGTEAIITLENITLQHEKGGTIAEITYRKGIV